MKPTLFALLLVPFAVAQKPADVEVQDVSAKGAPASVFVTDAPDIGLTAAVRNSSGKGHFGVRLLAPQNE